MERQLKNRIIRTMGLRQPFLLVPIGLNQQTVFTKAQTSSGSPNANQSYCVRFQTSNLNGFKPGGEIVLQFQGGSNGTNVGSNCTCTICRTLVGSTVVSDVTQVTVKGSSTIHIPSGFDQQGVGTGVLPSPILTDAAIVTVDTLHDYYVVYYFNVVSGTEVGFLPSTLTNSAWLQTAQASAVGDDTNAANMNVFPQSGIGSLQAGVTGGGGIALSAILWG